MKSRGVFTSLSILLVSLTTIQGSAQNTLIIPYFVADDLERAATPLASIDSIFTEILIVNPSDQSVDVTFESFDDNGNPIDAVTYRPRPVPPGGLGYYPILSTDPVSGWLRIRTSADVVVRATIRLARGYPTGFPISIRLAEAQADPTEPFTRATLPISFFDIQAIGVAIAFPAETGSQGVSVSLILRDTRGEVLGTTEVQVPPNGRRVFLLHDILPQTPQAGFQGILEISADWPVYATAIESQASPEVWRTVRFAAIP